MPPYRLVSDTFPAQTQTFSDTMRVELSITHTDGQQRNNSPMIEKFSVESRVPRGTPAATSRAAMGKVEGGKA